MLEIRLLGELSVVRDGAAVALPASRKARALVAYLAASRGPHLRERLCDLLWEGPDDPRAALRWTLTKLRPVLDPHLLAGRTHVELKTDGARVDLDGLVPPQRAETAALEDCAALFRGQFIEGLDLPACFRFQQWCVGERERLRGAHVAVLAELIRRLGPNDRTVAHARRWVAVDPFSDEAHAALIALLAGRGQTPEALRQYERCRELLERELGARPGPSVEAARRSVGRAALAADVKAPDTAETLVPLVGRAVELKAMAEAQGVVLLSGEPGIGKSRLLDEARARASGPTLHARAYAAERVRPYGVWIDALRARGRAFPNEADRERLFEAVADLLADAALVVLDDVQWLDEGSAALLHFLARGGVSGPRFLCAARVGEIDDNPHVSRVVRELLRERRLARLDVGPLEPAETLALVRAVDPQADAAQVLAGSGGNPLFALELARSRPEEGSAPRSLSSLIASRLDALDGDARNLVAWASAAGRQFDVDVLGRASLIPAGVLLPTLDKLERCAILRACGERQYEFTHDLLRDVAYQALSGPRRALAHRQIAAALEAQPDPEGALSGEILNHATLAGDLERAAEAAVLTGERCLRLFAYAEAVSVGRRGLQMAETLGEAARARVEIRLMRVIVMARTPLKERLALTAGLAEAVERARRQGLMDVAAQGAAGLAILNEEMNDYSLAAAATLRSAEMARGSDRATASFALATTARCLLLLQREVPRAESLLAEAQALVPESSELSLGFGYLHAHHG